MKISFPKYSVSELLTRKRGATRIISFVALALFATVCGSYFLGNKFWLLTIAVLGIAGILLCFGGAVAIFDNQSPVNEAPSAPVEKNVSRFIPQWDYRPRKKSIRARAALDSPSTETPDGFGSDPFGINDNVWLNDNSRESVAPTFVDGPPENEETITEALPQTTDSVSGARTVEDASVSRYD